MSTPKRDSLTPQDLDQALTAAGIETDGANREAIFAIAAWLDQGLQRLAERETESAAGS
ncbi:hypothetical protein [Cucumibacter marinus]|uniref:hypothetical protein n=1 Tax=Cucumibacter marinus TaxID=1121252 RepID=UPI0004117488|nr:hypothetical protein [Cucumibacter marinus]